MASIAEKRQAYFENLYAETLDEQVAKHIGREFDGPFLDLAIDKMGTIDAVRKEVARQLQERVAAGVIMRDGEGLPNAGLLDLSQFKFDEQEVQACVMARRQHGVQAALSTAQTVLGDDLFEQARKNLGSSNAVAEKFYDQIEARRKAGIPLRFVDETQTLRVAGYSLNEFGLDPQAAHEQEQANAHKDREYGNALDQREVNAFVESNNKWKEVVSGGGGTRVQSSHGYTSF